MAFVTAEPMRNGSSWHSNNSQVLSVIILLTFRTTVTARWGASAAENPPHLPPKNNRGLYRINQYRPPTYQVTIVRPSFTDKDTVIQNRRAVRPQAGAPMLRCEGQLKTVHHEELQVNRISGFRT
ncbi:MAG: hypothetical protein H8D56_25405 [Planctomycetes bacterium]|nr:hypothetical protein [Planctomycetota bacterium]